MRLGKPLPVMGCPINYYENNLYFNSSRGCWAAFKLKGFNYDFQSFHTKINALLNLAQTIKNVSHSKILVVPTTEDVEMHYNKIKKKIRSEDILYDSSIYHAEETCKYLKKTGQDWNDYTTYLLVRIQDEAVSETELTFKQMIEFFKAPLYGLMAALLLNPEDITTFEFKKYTRLAEEVYQILNACVKMQPLATNEMQWLLKRVNYKGLKCPVFLNKAVKITTDEETGEIRKEYSEEWTPYSEKRKTRQVEYYRPHKTDIAHLCSARFELVGNKGIKITHDDGKVSYQSYLVLTNIPLESSFPGREWIYNLQKQRVQVEICIDIQNIHYKKAADELQKIQTEVNTQIDNIAKANAVLPSQLGEVTTLIDGFTRELNDNKMPMCNTSVSICVSGPDWETVEAGVKELKQYFEKNDFTAARPGADQEVLYMQHIPGAESYATEFIKPLSPFTIASGVFGVNNRVGDNVGYYIGMANGKPVYLYLGQASLEDTSPAGTLYGDLGYGKSFNVNMLLFLHVLYGGYGLVICPKGERGHWQSMPMLGKHVNLVELTADLKNKGKLDPFNMFRNDLTYAKFLAENIFMDLHGQTTKREHTIFFECIEKVANGPNPSMTKVVDAIGQIEESDSYYQDAQDLYRGLKAEIRSGMLMLLFGDGTEEAIQIDGRLNVITLQGISFPDKNTPKEKYTQEEKVASVLFTPIVAFVRKFALMKPGVFKMTVIDESWALKSISAGSAMIEWLARQGRSLYHSLLLNGHSVLDLPTEELRTMMTYKFCFHTSDENEAKRMLEYLKLDITQENINILMSLGNGECLFSDLYGRVSRLKFDIIFGDLIKFFSTTPKEISNDPPALKHTEEPEIVNEAPEDVTQIDCRGDHSCESDCVTSITQLPSEALEADVIPEPKLPEEINEESRQLDHDAALSPEALETDDVSAPEPPEAVDEESSQLDNDTAILIAQIDAVLAQNKVK